MNETDAPEAGPLPPRPSEALLIEALEHHLPEVVERAVATTLGRAQLARHLAEARPGAAVLCPFLDLFLARQAELAVAPAPPNLALRCQADLPLGDQDLVLLPLSARGDGELTRDLTQAAAFALRPGGILLAAIDRADDQWLQEVLRRLFPKVSRYALPRGALYRAEKAEDPKKRKDYRCQFAFRHEGRLLQAVSRPGVFAHRRIDLGARALIDAVEVHPGDRVLDIGCGSGVVALATASVAPDARVTALDSNVRAVACTAEGARLNGLENLTATLTTAATFQPEADYALALANPPYYSDGKIGGEFVDLARRALRRGGRLLVVTKQPDRYLEHLEPAFDEVEAAPARTYTIVTGLKP